MHWEEGPSFPSHNPTPMHASKSDHDPCLTTRPLQQEAEERRLLVCQLQLLSCFPSSNTSNTLIVYITVKVSSYFLPSVSVHFFDEMEASPGSPWLPSPLGVRLQHIVLYSGKLSREKTFANFTVLWLFAKVFSTKFGGVASFGTTKVSNLRKFFPIFSQKFSPLKLSCYMVAIDFASSLTKWWLDIREMDIFRTKC